MCFTLCVCISPPVRVDDGFKVALDFHRIAVGTEKGIRSINHHPDLPQVCLGVHDNASSYLAETAWWFVPHGSQRLLDEHPCSLFRDQIIRNGDGARPL